MILHSELSRRRIRSIKKLIRVNKLEVVSVLRVDKDKGMWMHVYLCVYVCGLLELLGVQVIEGIKYTYPSSPSLPSFFLRLHRSLQAPRLPR